MMDFVGLPCEISGGVWASGCSPGALNKSTDVLLVSVAEPAWAPFCLLVPIIRPHSCTVNMLEVRAQGLGSFLRTERCPERSLP